MGINVERGEESTTLDFEGTIDIAAATELKVALLDVLKAGKPVRVAFEPNAALDIAAIQLLWAAEREAKASGIEFRLAAELPEAMTVGLKESGFERFPVPV